MQIQKICYKAFAIFCVLLILNSNAVKAQLLKKSANWILHHSIIDTTTPGHPSFRLYPTLAYAPETDLEIGLSTLYLFQARKDTNNRISELNAFTFFTLQSQYGIWLENALYGHKDKWFVLGRMRFQRFPLLYYGIGSNTTKDHPATIDANYFVIRQRVLRKVRSNLFFGPEIDYQNLSNT